MIDETTKLDELQLINDKAIELTIYFLDKITAKDINEYDKERFSDISSKFSSKMYEYIKSKSTGV